MDLTPLPRLPNWSTFCCKVLTGAILSLPATAQAAENETFSLSLGVFLTDRDTEARIDGQTNSPGTDVDLERDLDLDQSNSVFRIDGYYAFNEKHRIDFSWFDLSRSSSKAIDRDIQWNDTVFPVTTTLESDIDLDIYKVAYTWSLLRHKKNFLGVTGGLYIADTRTSLKAPQPGSREVASATAPLPVLGLRGQYYFSDRLSFRASGEFFLFESGDWDGDLIDLYAGIDYQLSDHFAIGVGYNSVIFDLGVAKDNFTGDLDWGYRGGMVFGRLLF